MWSRRRACQVLLSRGGVSGTGTVTACNLLNHLRQVSEAKDDTVSKVQERNRVKRSCLHKKKIIII